MAKAPGFEAFELLRPTDDRGVFYVYTRWQSAADFDAWVASAQKQYGAADQPAPTSVAAR